MNPDLLQQLSDLKDSQAPSMEWSEIDYEKQGYHFEIKAPADAICALTELIKENNYTIDTITAVDWLEAGEIELIYDFFRFEEQGRLAVRIRTSRDGGEVDTISHIFPGANWHEREAFDFFGVRFRNHPDLTRILLPEDADFHPLRKDYKPS